jgi:hypothetical protein
MIVMPYLFVHIRTFWSRCEVGAPVVQIVLPLTVPRRYPLWFSFSLKKQQQQQQVK